MSGHLLFATEFTAAGITAVRQRAEALARACGLGPERTSDWVTAVNELLTNVIRHGGGAGRVRIWRETHLICEVSDDGPGFPVGDYLERADRPTLSPTGGMGLWIVKQMTDSLTIESGPGGTTARINVTPIGSSA